MQKFIILLLVLIMIFSGCNYSLDTAAVKKNNTIAIKNVNVISMEKEELLTNQTVLISDGLISNIGASDKVEMPVGCETIDGKGKFLIPGLIDMHTHIMDKNDLKLFVSNGVTTIRNMAEFPDPTKYPGSIQSKLNYSDALSLKNSIKNGELLGPEIYQAGHVLDGNPPYHEYYCTPIEAGADIDSIVKAEKEKGYDYIKVYWNLSKSEYLAITAAAKKYDIKVIGHVPNSITYEDAVKSEMYTIEHLTGLYNPKEVMPNLDNLIKTTNESQTWICPTLIELKNILPRDNPQIKALKNREENKYISKEMLSFWDEELSRWGGLTGYAGEAIDYFKHLVAQFHKGGVQIIAGTDCGAMPYVLPGYSIHEEIELFTESGLSNYEALKSATINAARCLNQQKSIGSIAVGKKANLILLNGNPLKEIKNTKNISDVFLLGERISNEEIHKLLSSTEEK